MRKIERIFKVLADTNRLRILNLLQAQEMCVCEIAYILGVTQPSISRHLKKMKDADIVDCRKSGLWTDYYLKTDSIPAKELFNLLRIWAKDAKITRIDHKKMKKTDRNKLCGR